MIVPAAIRYQSELATAVNATKAAGVDNAPQMELLKSLTSTLNEFQKATAALDHAQQALSILLQLSAADPTNVLYRRNIGLCYEKFGDACTLLASNKKQSRARRVKTWVKARSSYKQGLDVFATLREQGKLIPADSGFAEPFAAKIAECDNRLEGSRR